MQFLSDLRVTNLKTDTFIIGHAHNQKSEKHVNVSAEIKVVNWREEISHILILGGSVRQKLPYLTTVNHILAVFDKLVLLLILKSMTRSFKSD